MTSPFAPAFETSLKQATQGGLCRLIAGHIVYPQYQCCLSGNTVGVDKPPVAILIVETTDPCVGSPICVDISHSYHPTGTTITYEVDWGDGNTSNGAWPPAGDVCHPMGGYAMDGPFEITLTLTDLLGVTDEDTVSIYAWECPWPSPEPIVGLDAEGPWWCLDIYDASPVWFPLEHDSLTVPGSMTANDILQYEWPSTGESEIFMATACGIYVLPLPIGTGPWVCYLTDADFEAAAGIAGQVSVNHICMDADPDREGHGYCHFTIDPGPGAKSCCVAETDDGWRTFGNVSIVLTDNAAEMASMVAIAQHSTNGSTLYTITAFEVWPRPYARIYKSTNAAASWTLLKQDVNDCIGSVRGVIWCPYGSSGHDDSRVYAGTGNVRNISTDGGGAWTEVNSGMVTPRIINGPWWNYSKTEYLSWDNGGAFNGIVREVTEGGVASDILPPADANSRGWDYLVTDRDGSGDISEMVIVGQTIGIDLIDVIAGTMTNIAGNLEALFPATTVTSINNLHVWPLEYPWLV